MPKQHHFVKILRGPQSRAKPCADSHHWHSLTLSAKSGTWMSGPLLQQRFSAALVGAAASRLSLVGRLRSELSQEIDLVGKLPADVRRAGELKKLVNRCSLLLTAGLKYQPLGIWNVLSAMLLSCFLGPFVWDASPSIRRQMSTRDVRFTSVGGRGDNCGNILDLLRSVSLEEAG